MKKKKSIILMLVTVLLFSFAVIGCGDKITPKESAQILWDVKLKGDVSGIEKLGGKDGDGQKLLDASKKSEMQLLKTNLTSSGLKATDEQLELVYNALMEACAKNTVTIEETSKSGDSAEVKIKCTYIDETAMDQKAADDAVKAAQGLGITNQSELLKKVTELYIENLVNEFKNAEVSSDTVEKTFTFKKDKSGYWMPDSPSDFIVNISKMATNQK